ncbi:hypothetical protein LABF186_18280 [Lactobacillus amylovorus subsp. animalium]|uniref:Uncharacterized protein n=1 Tax=Lactobacillus amylovorus subsp. animalium TaxID=3378536 RepID=A0ABD0C607_LACAM|nr:hypothetical protein LABF186_18280 [Lactobacillus amylovorus]GMM16664.1 hypothetical protein LABF125_17980 [Lactobacillus amylovorus]
MQFLLLKSIVVKAMPPIISNKNNSAGIGDWQYRQRPFKNKKEKIGISSKSKSSNLQLLQ